MFPLKNSRFSGFGFPFLVFFLFLLLAPFAYAAEEDSIQVNQAIRAKGARWQAGETSISKLPAWEKKNLLGALKPLLSQEEHDRVLGSSGSKQVTATPPALDWRGYNNYNYVTPVRNQGGCGSCWAFAATAALESRWLITQNNPGDDLNLSEQTLVSCSGAGTCGGGYINRASDYIRDLGLPSEYCFPYSATNAACTGACPEYQKAGFQISNWHWVATTAPSVEALKSALFTLGPLVTTMDVYTDFFSYRTGVYSYVTGSYQGGHAIVLVGYNDAEKYFIAKNSWGTGWGEAGYFKIAYGELNGLAEFGHYTIAYEDTPVIPPPPPASCSYSLSPASKGFKVGGGTGQVLVAAASDCTWTASSSAAWIRIDSPGSGADQGTGTVSYTVFANTGSARVGTLAIAGQSFIVKQAGVRLKGATK